MNFSFADTSTVGVNKCYIISTLFTDIGALVSYHVYGGSYGFGGGKVSSMVIFSVLSESI